MKISFLVIFLAALFLGCLDFIKLYLYNNMNKHRMGRSNSLTAYKVFYTEDD